MFYHFVGLASAHLACQVLHQLFGSFLATLISFSNEIANICEKLDDVDYVSKILEKNRKVSISMRKEIRKYAVNNFDWSHVIDNIYVPAVEKIINSES